MKTHRVRLALLAALVPCLALAARPARAAASLEITGVDYVGGCNQTSSAQPRIGELLRVVVTVKNTHETTVYKDVRTDLVCLPDGADATCGNPDIASGRTSMSVVGTLEPGQSADAWHYLRINENCTGGGNAVQLRAKIYYVDDPDNDDDPVEHDFNFNNCTNSNAPTAVADPDEVCCLKMSEVGDGVKYEWEHVDGGDRYNAYRGLVPSDIGDWWDDMTGGSKVRYTHKAIPATDEKQGFCTKTGLDPSTGNPYSGDLTPCPSGCSNTFETGHREITDEDEPSVPSGYRAFEYLLSAERDCLVFGEGREGTVGFDSLGNERAYGGGDCSPLN